MGLLTVSTVKNFEFHKSKMANGRHYKIRYIAICLQPVDRFGWNLAWWRVLASYSGKAVKISNFWKFKTAAANMLKITKITDLVCWSKMGLLTAPSVKKIRISQIQDGERPPFWEPLNRHISASVWPILMKFGTMTHIGPLQRKDGRHFKNRYIIKSQQPFDWFLLNLARWCTLVPRAWRKFPIFNFRQS